MNEFITLIISYVVVIIMGFVVINFLTWGFLLTYLRVKGSRGKKTLLFIRGVTRDFHKVGELTEGWLVYKHNKEKKRLKVSREAVFRTMGVNALQIDEEKNSVVNPDFSTVTGFDATKFENLYIRCLYAPTTQSRKEALMLLMMGACLIITIVLAFMVYNLSGRVDELFAALTTV